MRGASHGEEEGHRQNCPRNERSQIGRRLIAGVSSSDSLFKSRRGRLKIKDPEKAFCRSFHRPNLYLAVFTLEFLRDEARLGALLRLVARAGAADTPCSRMLVNSRAAASFEIFSNCCSRSQRLLLSE